MVKKIPKMGPKEIGGRLHKIRTHGPTSVKTSKSGKVTVKDHIAGEPQKLSVKYNPKDRAVNALWREKAFNQKMLSKEEAIERFTRSFNTEADAYAFLDLLTKIDKTFVDLG